MKRSLIFVNVMMLLFIFQSLWNVSASFCQHENDIQSVSQINHFGHHKIMSYEHKNVKTEKKPSLNLNWLNSLVAIQSIDIIDDHQDHLPSFAHYIVKDVHIKTEAFIDRYLKFERSIYWNSFYQSPDLSSQTPPPELTLL